jgi:hypothetical protein
VAEMTTKSDATHPIDIIAPIRLWPGFEMQVRLAKNNAKFRDTILDHQPAGFLSTSHASRELYACSDEGDIQGRFNNNNVSKVMTAIFQSEGIMCKFSSGGGVPILFLQDSITRKHFS